MQKKLSKIVSLFILVCLAISLVSCGSAEKTGKYEFKYWNECSALNNLKDYVEDVTDEKSKDFIPVADRIAVFDMDGTLYGELFPTYLEYLLFAYRALDDKNFQADEETKEVAEMQGLIDIYFAQAATTGNFVDTLHAVRDVLSPDFYSTKRPFDLCELGKRPLLQ